jgi:hypothetical protein
MAFEFENISENTAFEAEYRPNKKIPIGQGLKLEINQDIVTAEFLEQAADSMRRLVPEDETIVSEEKESTKEAQNKERIRANLSNYEGTIKEIRAMARILGGKPGANDVNDRVVRQWDLIRGGEEVKISFDEFYSWKFSDLSKFYTFCVFEASDVKKKKSGKSE